jgi:hypothetical protein
MVRDKCRILALFAEWRRFARFAPSVSFVSCVLCAPSAGCSESFARQSQARVAALRLSSARLRSARLARLVGLFVRVVLRCAIAMRVSCVLCASSAGCSESFARQSQAGAAALRLSSARLRSARLARLDRWFVMVVLRCVGRASALTCRQLCVAMRRRRDVSGSERSTSAVIKFETALPRPPKLQCEPRGAEPCGAQAQRGGLSLPTTPATPPTQRVAIESPSP